MMMRLALAVSVLALAGAAHAVPTAKPHASAHAAHAARPAKPLKSVRAVIVSGDGQAARAYAAPAAAAYQTEFPKPVVVTVDGPPVPKDHPRHVVFTCVTNGCIFAGAEQHEFNDYTNRAKTDDKDVDNAYDARVNAGRAGAHLILQTHAPAGTYTIRALPVANAGERAVPAWFTLRTF
ncbi:MAG TPA: hypothetical protein VE826_06350 [Dongiaceae bacterium]|nr:hypothetical protein [Dongiaceae bacterium]